MWDRKFLLVGILLFQSVTQAMIYGDDNRRPLSMEYAEKIGLRPIVYLLIKKPAGLAACNGAWISNTRILTARHCVANARKILVINQFHDYLGETRALGKRVFVDKSSPSDQNLWYGRKGKNNDSRANGKDWAVIEVAYENADSQPDTIVNSIGKTVRNLEKYGDGSTNGKLSIINSEILKEDPSIELAAYHSDADKTLYRQYCNYKARDIKADYWLMWRPGLIEFDCDMVEGASGAPLLKCDGRTCDIVGVVSGEFPTEDKLNEFDARHGNSAVPSKSFMKDVNAILAYDNNSAKSFYLQKPRCKLTSCLNR
jgi:V8-like Glu-specific endopeptidase